MKAIEFKSKIRENRILVLRKMQPELIARHNKSVRIEDSDVSGEKAYEQMTKSQFLKGYTDSDSIYDL